MTLDHTTFLVHSSGFDSADIGLFLEKSPVHYPCSVLAELHGAPWIRWLVKMVDEGGW